MHPVSRMKLCSLRAPLFDLTRSPSSTSSPTVLFIGRRLHIPSLLWHLDHSRCFLLELIEIEKDGRGLTLYFIVSDRGVSDELNCSALVVVVVGVGRDPVSGILRGDVTAAAVIGFDEHF